MQKKILRIPKNHLILILVLLIVSNSQRVENEQLKSSKEIQYQIEKNLENKRENITVKQWYQHLNQQIQTLSEEFMQNYVSLYHKQTSRLFKAFNDESQAGQLNLNNIRQDPGNFLLLLAKMYLYNFLPKNHLSGNIWSLYQSQSPFILGYFYLKVAAQKYANSQAYYYLALLDYYKLNPHQTLIKNIESQINRIQKQQGYQKVHQTRYQQLLEYLRNQRFTSVQHNLFLSSLLGHHGSSLVLANMYRQGLGVDKNCTTSLSYYLSVVKNTYVDFYEFRSAFSDEKNFQKQLYSKKKIAFQNKENTDVVENSQFFDTQTIKATYELAENYFIGRGGFKKNYQKSAQLYGKLAGQDHKQSMSMLGMCYFKGQGVPIDRRRARVLFEHSNKVSVSEAMLIVMDYFQIESIGTRSSAIKKLKQIYDKKKDFMNPILKYLLGSLVLKGDVKEIKTDDGVLLLGSAAKQGHGMAKIVMGLLFADGIDVNYDCIRSINYFSQEALSHPFFMDKFYMARIGLMNQKYLFSLIKYLELTTVGETNSFINSLYILQTQKENSLGLNQNSWNIAMASNNLLYQKLKKQKILPDIYSYLLKQFAFFDQKPILKYQSLQKFLLGSNQVKQTHYSYIKKKIIKVCAITKQNSLMNFYQYKMSRETDPTLLNTIANGQPDKLHVLQSRYLLGQYYHKKSFESIQKGKDHTKQQYKALQEYKRSTNSQIIGKILFYLEQVKLNPFGIDPNDEVFQFEFINDLLTYTLILSIAIFVLYYKRSKKLDQIHRKELEKRFEQQKEKRHQDQSRNNQQLSSTLKNEQRKEQQRKQNIWNEFQQSRDKMMKQEAANQPQIIEETNGRKGGVRIGGSEQQIVIQQVYKFEQTQVENDKEKNA